MAREIEVEPMRKAFLTVRDYFQQARAGDVFVDGALIEFLRVLFANPELLIWDTNYFKDATGLLALKGYVYANHDLEAGFTRCAIWSHAVISISPYATRWSAVWSPGRTLSPVDCRFGLTTGNTMSDYAAIVDSPDAARASVREQFK